MEINVYINVCLIFAFQQKSIISTVNTVKGIDSSRIREYVFVQRFPAGHQMFPASL